MQIKQNHFLNMTGTGLGTVCVYVEAYNFCAVEMKNHMKYLVAIVPWKSQIYYS